MAGTMKRWLTWIFSGVVAASLVVGVAFAGTSNSSGGGADNGTKSGTGNKPIRDCPHWPWDGPTLVFDGGADYDLNGDGYICWKYVDGEIDFTDNSSNGS